MENIIPRWEWRTFGESFGESDDQFAVLEPGGVQESDELYFLSPANNENVKVRNLLMDIKTLEQVNPDGLEQWKPVMKAAFPLPAAAVKTVFSALGISSPPLARKDYTLEQFVTELVEPSRQVRVVKVHKKRTRYKIDSCTSEMTEVVADGKKTRTVALESEDPARVIATVRKLGLDRFENISYPRGLKKLAGMNG
jgi:exopolyphosphatase / guanosine-5'-triphosphate,3'-diphosphate pyrophosphatase